MLNENKKEITQETIDSASREIFRKWELLDKPRDFSLDELEFFQNVEELIKTETGLLENEIEVKKCIEKVDRTRNDIGEIIIGNNVIKKIEIVDDYKGYSKPLKSIAYYQLLPVMDSNKPITRILQWVVSHHPCWVIWFTSPLAKGFKARTNGEYIVVHSLNEKESQNHDLLVKYSKFPCFGRGEGVDILLGFTTLEEAVEFVERFLPTIIERNLYGDSEFLRYLQNFKRIQIDSLVER